MKPSEFLKKIAVAFPRSMWTTYRDAENETHRTCNPRSNAAVKFCAQGLIKRAVAEKLIPARSTQVILAAVRITDPRQRHLTYINDFYGLRAVRLAFKRAAVHLKESGK